MRRALAVGLMAIAGAVLVGFGSPALTRETAPTGGPLRLIMIEEPGCSFCLRWRQDVEPGYTNSTEGQRAPLQTAMRGDPAIRQIERIVYTPTFVLMQGETEIGRIVGYAGADLFWWQLGELWRKLPPATTRAGAG